MGSSGLRQVMSSFLYGRRKLGGLWMVFLQLSSEKMNEFGECMTFRQVLSVTRRKMDTRGLPWPKEFWISVKSCRTSVGVLVSVLRISMLEPP